MAGFEEIQPTEVQELITNGKAVIVDIRDEGSFGDGHLPGAVSVNKENLEEFLKKVDRSKALVCYCYHGHSSRNAAQFFSENGFEKVYSMTGGYEAWAQDIGK